MDLRELSLRSVPWPAMNRVMSAGLGARGNGNFVDDLAGAGEQHIGHAVVRADGLRSNA